MSTEEEGFTVAKINGVYWFSCYASPSLKQLNFEILLDKIVKEARDIHSSIIADDFTAWSEEWESRLTNCRGRTLMEDFSPLDVILANRGNTSTFRRGNQSSVIDITFASRQFVSEINWQVRENYTHSDHQALTYEIHPRVNTNNTRRGSHYMHRTSWVTKSFNEDLFCELLCEVELPMGNNDNDNANQKSL